MIGIQTEKVDIKRIYLSAYSKLRRLNAASNFDMFLLIDHKTALNKGRHFNETYTGMHEQISLQRKAPDNIVSEIITREYSRYIDSYPDSLNSTDLSERFRGLVDYEIWYNIVTNCLPSRRSMVFELIPMFLEKFSELEETTRIQDYESSTIKVAALSQVKMFEMLYRISSDPNRGFGLGFLRIEPEKSEKIHVSYRGDSISLNFEYGSVEYRVFDGMIFRSAISPKDELGRKALSSAKHFEQENPEFLNKVSSSLGFENYNSESIYTAKTVRNVYPTKISRSFK